MNFLTFGSPLVNILALILLVGALFSLRRGVRLLAKGLRHPEDPEQTLRVVRGLRGGIIAVGLASLAAGLLSGGRWLLVFGAVFLGEELLETGIMLLALRSQRRDGKDKAE